MRYVVSRRYAIDLRERRFTDSVGEQHSKARAPKPAADRVERAALRPNGGVAPARVPWSVESKACHPQVVFAR